MKLNGFMLDMICSEFEDVVGQAYVSRRNSDQISYSVDYFWLSRMWADRGEEVPRADIIVNPASAEEVSKILVIANYYKIPVSTWGGQDPRGEPFQ